MSAKANPAMFFNEHSRRQVIVGAVLTLGGLAFGPGKIWAVADEGIFHNADATHQEPVFTANRKRVYEALTNPTQFHKVTLLSGAMRSGMAPSAKPTEISSEVGGAFQLFGGYLTGRHLDFLPNERIVQAWRAGSWGPGLYSIARFQLIEEGTGTRIIFDHTGFPAGTAQHLADGWKENYWQPLEKFLA